jgi:predicted DNA-binding transcriptional regulator AlpA
MKAVESLPAEHAITRASNNVAISPWVNERFPDWEQLLSARDVARLTRRPRWIVLSLALLGRFPRKRRFHGRGIGWLRSDVLHWLTRDLRTIRGNGHCATVLRPGSVKQLSLPLRRSRGRTQRRRR